LLIAPPTSSRRARTAAPTPSSRLWRARWRTLANVENLTYTGSASLDAVGNALANVLTGNEGNNRLDGGANADTLIGGVGNDTYVVDNLGDDVVEHTGEGTDMVLSSVTFTLLTQAENVTLTGTGAINATGNELDNVLTGNGGANVLDGNEGHDTLDGKVGADTMIGGLGNDTYVVDNLGDRITELADGGTDGVLSSVTFSLVGSEVENVTLTGTGAINATGNELDNVLTGNGGANVLDGNEVTIR
jgi:Ca2+-binding RTX toxin-like protein